MAERLRLFTVCETKSFARVVGNFWSDSEHDEFVAYIAANPFEGVVVPETGGVRKIRWSRQGMGKRGGVRIIYYVYDETLPLFLLTAFAKNESDDLGEQGKKAFRDFVAELKAGVKARRVR
jgi:hypothetical protein